MNFELFIKLTKLLCSVQTKIKIKPLDKANVIYKFKCPGCSNEYIGKTERNLITRLKEHGDGETDSAINMHLQHCTLYRELLSFNSILYTSKLDYYKLNLNTILLNTHILAYHDRWSHLSFLESYFIKYFNPSLNTGTRAAKEMKLF